MAESCTACGLCSHFCPTSALVQAVDKDRFQVRFAAAACIDCGLCAQACPSAALHFAATLPAAALVVATEQVLIAGNLARCKACGTPTAVQPGEPVQNTCYVCRAASAAGRGDRTRGRRTLFDQLAAQSARQPEATHQIAGAQSATPSCKSEGVIA